MDELATNPLSWGTLLTALLGILVARLPAILDAARAYIEAQTAKRKAEGDATKARGDAILAEAQARRIEAETTGRFAVEQSERIDALEASHRRCDEKVAKLEEAVRARDALIAQMQIDMRELRRDIAAGGPGALLAQMLDAVRRLRNEMVAAGGHASPAIAEACRLVGDAARAAERMVA